MHRDLKS
jgi:NIMA (never in mitosis gene a)-related kinase 1/4/5